MSDEESDSQGEGVEELIGAMPGGGSVGVDALHAAARKRAKLLAGNKNKPLGRPLRTPSSSSRTRPVVKLLVTSVSRSYSEPWRRRQQRESSGTGFLIRWKNTGTEGSGGAKTTNSSDDKVDAIRIVTNAHVVRNASTVRARASFGPHVVNCKVEWMSLPLDLALLKITEGDWNEFCKGWSFGELSTATATALANKIADGTKEDEAGTVGAVDASSDVTVDPTNANAAVDNPPDGTTTNNNGNNGNAIKRKVASGGSSSSSSSGCLTLSSGLPKLDENVTCVGFPQGGTQISVTRGVVSRIDVDSNFVLRIQIDAAINPGNSGGPVFDERGQVVGVASSHLRAAANIGYIIPSKIVGMFLQMCMDGMTVKVEDQFSGLGELVVRTTGSLDDEPKHVPGIPNLAIQGSQTLESKALRVHLGLNDLDLSGGIRIVGAVGGRKGEDDAPTANGDGGGSDDGNESVPTQASTTTSLDGKDDGDSNKEEATGGERLEGDDVLLAINKIPIGMDGTIQLSPTRPDERINFRSIVTCQRVGSRVSLDVLRNKQRRELDVELDMSRFLVSQYDDFDSVPLYAVVGGCVFSPLSLPLVQEKKSKNPSSFSRYFRDQRAGNEQLLVLSKVLNDEVNVGYHGWKNLVLKSVNGYEPTNIQDLVSALVRKMPAGEMVEFRCQVVGQEDADYVICMNLNDALQSEQRVLSQHMIASWCSTDALSKELREEMEKSEPSEAKRMIAFHTMKDMREILERKEEK